jgi:hypothetical protein
VNVPDEKVDQVTRSATTSGSEAFSVDTVGCLTIHSDICALTFGALYCSCAADIAGFPLYENAG